MRALSEFEEFCRRIGGSPYRKKVTYGGHAELDVEKVEEEEVGESVLCILPRPANVLVDFGERTRLTLFMEDGSRREAPISARVRSVKTWEVGYVDVSLSMDNAWMVSARAIELLCDELGCTLAAYAEPPIVEVQRRR